MLGIPQVFVCASGSDDTGDGTEAAPYSTIGKALRGLPDGSLIELFIEDETDYDAVAAATADGETPPPDLTPKFEADRAAHLHVFMRCWRRKPAHERDLYVRAPQASREI